MPVDAVNKADKGQYGGSCNRTACQAPGAVYYNTATQQHYCRDCARRINEVNGQVLCRLVRRHEMHETGQP